MHHVHAVRYFYGVLPRMGWLLPHQKMPPNESGHPSVGGGLGEGGQNRIEDPINYGTFSFQKYEV